jgi:proline iminopeptidase
MATSEYLTTDDGVSLFLQKAGSGPELLLPNGFHLFDDFQHLADRYTLVFYDVRNRGRSETIVDPDKLSRGILNDVDDLEAVRRHLGIERVDLIAHSYIGILAAAYATSYPERVHRMVLIGAMQPDSSKQYPPDPADSTTRDIFMQIGEIQKNLPPDPQEACEKFWSVLRCLYVTDPADAAKIRWGRCDLPNERNFVKYWMAHILPSIQSLRISWERIAAPVLVIHGDKDRSAPYLGGREWAAILPNARLITVENGGHAPWIEAPDLVFGPIRDFLAGDSSVGVSLQKPERGGE